MSQQDLQFIERALAHPWMFCVYFWKWPRIVRQVCAEYDLIAKELDTAKASHEQAVRANEKVAQWIKVTHQLDMTADLRAIWTAGKRLSILLVFFVVTNAFGQAPPYLRQYFTTNAHVLSSGAGVLTNNGVGTPGTLGWKSLSDFAGIGDLVWTNNATHIWPAGSGVSGTAVGAPIAIRYDGSLFIGTNAAQDIGSAFTSGDTFMRPIHAVSYIDSNGPTRMTIYGSVADSLNYTYFSDVLFRFDGNQSTPISRMEFNAVGTNASLTARTRLFLDPAFAGSGTQFSITEDSADRIALQPNIPDGSSAVAFLLNSRRNLTNTGSKLFSLQNTNVEKVHVKYNGSIYSATLTPSTVLWANSSTNIASIANGAGVLTNDGAGVVGWKPLSDFTSGGGIASVYTNNVLAGGPGLTELEFTNTPTVTVAATTNAGRVTMSFTSSAAAAGLTNHQTGDVFFDDDLIVTNGALVAGPSRIVSSIYWFNNFISAHAASYVNAKMAQDDNMGGLYLANDRGVNWAAAANLSAFTKDTGIYRSDVASVAIGNGTAGNIAGSLVFSNGFLAGRLAVTNDLYVGGGITNNALTASKLVRTDATKKLVSSTLDESDIAAKQAGSAVLTNLSTTRAVTNMTVTTITNVGVSLYTVPSGCAYIFVECIGGGGGGGGVDGATSQSAAGGGGGSGAYCATNITTPAASYIVTVGTNGPGGAAGNNNGHAGGTTTFTNILTALGGSGGSGDASAAGVGFAVGGAGALQTATGRVYTGGNPGHNGICVSSALAVSGGGAGSHFGGGGAPQTADVGQNATGKGAGGSGAAVITNVDRAGGNGSPGIIVIREFYQ